MYDVTVFQSGVIPFYSDDGVITYVLIRSNQTGTFIFPKGMIELDMTPQQSAAQEALEEAGLEGKVFQNAAGTYEYQKFGLDFSVDLYPFAVEHILEDWDEPWRDRQFVPYSSALKSIDDRLKEILREFHSQAQRYIDSQKR